MNNPSPSNMPTKRVEHTFRPLAADIDESQKGKSFRPGFETVIGDGVIKAKQVKVGMKVRAYLHGAPRGSEKTVVSVVPSEDGGTITIGFDSGVVEQRAAAYRFYALDGVASKVPALVEVDH